VIETLSRPSTPLPYPSSPTLCNVAGERIRSRQLVGAEFEEDCEKSETNR